MKESIVGGIRTIEIDDLEEFEAKADRSSHVVYRGQTVDAPLVPKIVRPWKNSTEWFRVALEREERILAEFRRRAVLHGPVPTDTGDFLAYAQHWGVATRLLDWSTNPLVGMFFAVDGATDRSATGVVWQLETETKDFLTVDKDFDFFDHPRTFFFHPNHITSRIEAQFGLFSVMRLTDEAGFPFERLPRFRERLTKFVVTGTFTAKVIRRQLSKMGFNRATMFRDLANLAEHLSWSVTEDVPYWRPLMGKSSVKVRKMKAIK